MQNLQEELIEILKNIDHLVIDGELNKNKVVELALQVDAQLLKLLIKHPTFKNHFFTDVEGVLVFDKIAFQRFVNNKSFLPDSYTAFKNKIGLAINDGTTDNYLNTKNDTVLVWPHKDCILEGGQTKEDQKRNEIFWNETLAPNEVDRLLDPKVFTNFKKYDADGEDELEEFKGNENLIIKGNNLIALASLKKRYAGKVKLIYIDPPYNTGNDSFGYNDNFNNSTWLTFMFNRLKQAKELLRQDGVIFVQINDHNVANTKLLLSEVFGDNNFINLISVRTKSPSGFKTVNLGLFETAEYIVMFGKSKNDFIYNTQYTKSEYDENYSGFISNISEDSSKWIITDIRKIICKDEGVDPEKVSNPYKKTKEKIGEAVYFQKLSDFALNNASSVFRLTEIGGDAGKSTLEIKEKSKLHPDKIFEVKRENKSSRYILKGQELSFYSKKIKTIDAVASPTTLLTNIWSDIAWEGIASEGNVTLKKGKKPERLLRRIIEMASNSGDIVMDYHLGSGTTCAVAHKLNRKYIGIEQLDYDQNDSIVRLKNVIANEQTGVSKIVNWQGGGSFVYCELKENNQTFINALQQSNTKDEVLAIWQEMQNKATLSYQFDRKTFNQSLDTFKTAPLDDMKKYLIEVIDKNQLYVNYSDIKDSFYNVSGVDKKLNKEFYKVK